MSAEAAILSTGSELVRGELVNGNACWLAGRLTALGFAVVEQCAVGDDRGAIEAALRRLSGRERVVVVTGGLGPTTDDVTAEAAARAAGVGLKRDPDSVEVIRSRFEKFGRAMPESNLKQADLPEGAEVLKNRKGTAPGFALTIDRARCFFLPGVPMEMETMFESGVAPRIDGLAVPREHQEHVLVYGLTESRIADMLSGLGDGHLTDPDTGARVAIGYRASFPVIEIKVLARAQERQQAEKAARRVAGQVRELLGEAVFGGRGDTFPEYFGRVMSRSGLRLAVAESCTGGLIGKLITDVPGSSDYLLLDAVTYSDAAKSAVLEVDPELIARCGAVSGEVARAMAEGAMRISGADIAVAVTGIAGPGGGSEQKSVGTVWFGLARKGSQSLSRSFRFPGDRARVRVQAAHMAMKLVVDCLENRP
jgi:nicotinamide-nucleotide amidase